MDYTKNIINKLSNLQNIFLTGGAGVGKTTTTINVIKSFEKDGKKVAKLGSTGMAATLIGGQTIHSFFDFGISNCIDTLVDCGKGEISKKLQKLLSAIDLIVIDEISMVSDTLLDMVEYRLVQSGYKGVVMVVGDFLQLPPVVKNVQTISYAFEAKSWDNFKFEKIELNHIFRTDDLRFIELLSNVRVGFVDEDIHNHLNEYIKPLPQNCSDFTYLFGKNISASQHNKIQLEQVEGELFLKEARVVLHQKNISQKEVSNFFLDARIDELLEIKIGAPVLFSTNSWNFFNGQRGVVVNIDSTYIYVQKSDGFVVKLEPFAQTKSKWVEMVEDDLFTIYQYPIKLAYAITIHKSQGMSIEDLIIQTNEIFAPSQFYVALSRSSNPKRLNLIAPLKQWHQIIYVDNKALEFSKV